MWTLAVLKRDVSQLGLRAGDTLELKHAAEGLLVLDGSVWRGGHAGLLCFEGSVVRGSLGAEKPAGKKRQVKRLRSEECEQADRRSR